MQSGNIFVISAPSGAGKSSLVDALCKLDNNIHVSISHTTRKIRPGEIDGKSYYFISQEEFADMLDKNQFLEHAEVYGNFYGTHINTIKKPQNEGQDIILEIDWQGARQVNKIFPDATSIFILPPSLNVLKSRLINRNTDSLKTINDRLDKAAEDISHAKEFKYIVINDDFDAALKDIYSIILVQRLKAEHVLKSYQI